MIGPSPQPAAPSSPAPTLPVQPSAVDSATVSAPPAVAAPPVVSSLAVSPPAVPGQPAVSEASGAAERPGGSGRPPRQYSLDLLRILAICGVVAIHIIGTIAANEDLKGSATWWAAMGIDMGAVWTVPVFVMISGALTLAPRAHAAGPATFYRKRFTRIIPALIFWHLFYLVVVRMLMRGQRITPMGALEMLLDAQVFTALYFLWLIAGLYVIAPVLAAFLRDGGRRRALISAGVALAFTVVMYIVANSSYRVGFPRPIKLSALTMWWPYVGYFLAGWALHRVVLRKGAVLLAGVVATVLLAEGVWQRGIHPRYLWLQSVLPISYVGASVVIASICLFLVAVNLERLITPSPRAGRFLIRLSEASFGVFLVHLAVFEVARQTLPVVADARSLPVMLVTLAGVLVASFSISMGAARVPYVRAVF